jgi:putative ABC transport system ATP-binding protein
MNDTIAEDHCVLTVRGLHKRYRLGDETVHALRGVDLDVRRGAFIAIMGASGSGKTTLLHLIGGLDLPDQGRVTIDGSDVTALSDGPRTLFRRRRLGIVFQAYNLMPTLSALENVMLPLLADGQSAAVARRRAEEALLLVHLESRKHHRPATLSGGEQQRVAIARALINNPALILADEPTGNLDPTASASVWRLLRELTRMADATVLMVTHEAAAAAQADCVHVLKQGQFAGVIESERRPDATLVAARYAELAD